MLNRYKINVNLNNINYLMLKNKGIFKEIDGFISLVVFEKLLNEPKKKRNWLRFFVFWLVINLVKGL